jgi:hypothetical protein
VWDIPPREICDRHLIAEHAEIHAVMSVIRGGKRGFASHPEVMRWRGHLGALGARHELVAGEMAARGFRHATPIQTAGGGSEGGAVRLLVSQDEQRAILRAKACLCRERVGAGP